MRQKKHTRKIAINSPQLLKGSQCKGKPTYLSVRKRTFGFEGVA